MKVVKIYLQFPKSNERQGPFTAIGHNDDHIDHQISFFSSCKTKSEDWKKEVKDNEWCVQFAGERVTKTIISTESPSTIFIGVETTEDFFYPYVCLTDNGLSFVKNEFGELDDITFEKIEVPKENESKIFRNVEVMARSVCSPDQSAMISFNEDKNFFTLTEMKNEKVHHLTKKLRFRNSTIHINPFIQGLYFRLQGKKSNVDLMIMNGVALIGKDGFFTEVMLLDKSNIGRNVTLIGFDSMQQFHLFGFKCLFQPKRTVLENDDKVELRFKNDRIVVVKIEDDVIHEVGEIPGFRGFSLPFDSEKDE